MSAPVFFTALLYSKVIRAKHHIILYPFFRNFVFLKMKRSFASCKLIGTVVDNGKAILWIANHVSWWDGIWVLWANEKLFGRKFHFMMLEEQLRKNWFFRYTGGFSVRKGTRSVMESLKYTAELLSNPKNMVLMFPQGKIQSMHRSQFSFEKGVEKILTKNLSEIQVVFQANFVDYLSKPKPVVYQYINKYEGAPRQEALEDAYNRFYTECLTRQSAKSS